MPKSPVSRDVMAECQRECQPGALRRATVTNVCSIASGMTSDGRPCARFRRALDVRSVFQAETAARELARLGLNDALDYLVLLAAEDPGRFERAARKWLARLLAESPALTLDEAVVALGCLRGLREGYRPSRDVLRALVKRRHETRGR